MPGSFCPASFFKLSNDADWIDNRVRTMSKGYVVETEVIPARPPQNNRWYGPRGAPGVSSKNCIVLVKDRCVC